jgi:hypothetical protein
VLLELKVLHCLRGHFPGDVVGAAGARRAPPFSDFDAGACVSGREHVLERRRERAAARAAASEECGDARATRPPDAVAPDAAKMLSRLLVRRMCTSRAQGLVGRVGSGLGGILQLVDDARASSFAVPRGWYSTPIFLMNKL